MADALPNPPSAIAEAVSKYRPRVVGKKAVQQHDDERKTDRTPDPLTLMCLRVVAKHFHELQPNLDDMPPKFVAAITSMLPDDLDITISSPLVNDEKYWKRVCVEGKRWDNCEIAEHGLSWKQLFFERNLAEELEGFGVYTGITRKHEDEMLRPPIDSTHPRWASLYPKLPVNAPDGLPMKERFCKYGVDCKAIAIASSPTGIWPSLDRCKSVVPGNLQLYVETYAHAHLDPEAVAAAKEAAAAAAGATGGAAASLAASQRQPFGAGGVGQQPKPGAPPAKPAAAGEVEPEVDPDADCDGNVLREYVGPSVISEFQSTGMWPAQRQPCLLCKRAEELEKLTRKIKASEDYVFSLGLQQLLSHIDLELVFKYLPNLSNLELTYGVRKIGMKYERSLFGMKISDAMSLAKCVKATDTLTSLVLPCNMIDDDLLRMLMTGLVHNQTITHLDLSHNKITNHGVRLLSKIIGSKSVVMSLNLCDNQIHKDGGKYLGRALKRNDSLIDLNLRLNRLDDEGGRMLFEGLRNNASVTALNVCSNAMQGESAKALAVCLSNPECALVSVDMSGNRLNESDADLLKDALQESVSLTALDLRANPDIPASSDALAEILRTTRRNELHQRKLAQAE